MRVIKSRQTDLLPPSLSSPTEQEGGGGAGRQHACGVWICVKFYVVFSAVLYYIISNFSNIFEFFKIFHPLSILILFAWAWQKQLGYVLISNTVSIYFWIFWLGYSLPSSLIWILKKTPSCVYIHCVRLERDRNSKTQY